MQLSGKTALITGGAQGLGKGFAEAVLENGGQVVLVDINPSGQDTANGFVSQYGPGSAFFISCDVTDENQLRNAFEITRNMFGFIDIVVNNAGIANEENWRKMIDINMIAVIQGSYMAVEFMSKENGGRGGLIINTGSTAGLTGVPFEVIYAATKHAVVGTTRSLALRHDAVEGNVRVCCICPSFTETSILKDAKVLDHVDGQPMIDGVGIMQVSDVVKAFIKIVEWDDLNGGVVVVTPKGIKVMYPKKYKAKL